MKKTILKMVALCTVCALSMGIATGCGSSSSSSSSSSKKSSVSSKASTSSTTSKPQTSSTYTGIVDAPEIDQLAPPTVGEQIATITVANYGTIKVRLFPEQAPKAVENFIGIAEAGKYEGVPFHRIIQDFMIQSGDTSLNDGDGKSIWGDGFGIEVSETLRHYSGALAMARFSDQMGGREQGQSSQFYIVSNENIKVMSDTEWDSMEAYFKSSGMGISFAPAIREKYNEVGGAPNLDMQYTVFGQVYEGLDVVNKIAAVPVSAGPSGEQSTPVDKIIVDKVEISKYEG